MSQVLAVKPTVLVIFGGAGDLAWRKLAPSLYNLFVQQRLPGRFAVIGIDRKEMSINDFRQRLRDGVKHFCELDIASWDKLAPDIDYLPGDFGDKKVFKSLAGKLKEREKAWGEPLVSIFYLATPPEVMEDIVNGLAQAGLAQNRRLARIVLEKPFGHDLDSANELNSMLTGVFDEGQIYRIDHYLGKETVQNILAFRFANALFEPVWDRRYIDHIQVTVAEEEGVEHRGGYYEHAGALRDMVQNHLVQILCMVAMEPMVSFDADEIRNKKLDVLRAIRPIPEEQVEQFAARGQYGPGWLEGEQVPGYRKEPGVDPNSNTETFAAVKLFVDNWRWQDVPFYLRTGKRLRRRISEVAIQFRPVPHQSFPASAGKQWPPNRLIVRIQPEEAILLQFQAKLPGPEMRLSLADMEFSYQERFHAAPPEAYQTLLLDVMEGEATLFMRADQVEASWKAIMPILRFWEEIPPTDFPNYEAGTWGPAYADALIAQDGRHWLEPV